MQPLQPVALLELLLKLARPVPSQLLPMVGTLPQSILWRRSGGYISGRGVVGRQDLGGLIAWNGK
jgi:hypothetical protein